MRSSSTPSTFALGLLLCATTLAAASRGAVAAPSSGTDELRVDGATPYPVYVPASRTEHVSARQLIPEAVAPHRSVADASAGAAAAQASPPTAQSRIIYLNRNGATLSPAATNDSRANRSTIASKSTTVPRWNASAEMWGDTVQCMREIFAPFAVQLVTEDPGDVPHIEALFGGSASQFGLAKGVVGISPFTSTCSIIENSIVFTFTEDLARSSARTICEVMAQEVAHSFGLDHEMLPSDPMTYLPFSGKRSFQNQLSACGESSERPCGIGGSVCRAQQNSVALLRERLGVADAQGPTGAVMYPTNGQLVGSEFDIDVDANDNIGISSVEFFLDGDSAGVKSEAPYSLSLQGVAVGEHTVTVVIYDHARNTDTHELSVTVEAQEAGGCSAAPSGGSGAGAGLLMALGLVALRRRGR